MSEPQIAGAAAAVFLASGKPGGIPTIEQSEAFLAEYEAARGTQWTDRQREVCWATGLWVRAFNAKKEAVRGAGSEVEQLASEYEERLERAGA